MFGIRRVSNNLFYTSLEQHILTMDASKSLEIEKWLDSLDDHQTPTPSNFAMTDVTSVEHELRETALLCTYENPKRFADTSSDGTGQDDFSMDSKNSKHIEILIGRKIEIKEGLVDFVKTVKNIKKKQQPLQPLKMSMTAKEADSQQYLQDLRCSLGSFEKLLQSHLQRTALLSCMDLAATQGEMFPLKKTPIELYVGLSGEKHEVELLRMIETCEKVLESAHPDNLEELTQLSNIWFYLAHDLKAHLVNNDDPKHELTTIESESDSGESASCEYQAYQALEQWTALLNPRWDVWRPSNMDPAKWGVCRW